MGPGRQGLGFRKFEIFRSNLILLEKKKKRKKFNYRKSKKSAGIRFISYLSSSRGCNKCGLSDRTRTVLLIILNEFPKL